MNLEKLGNDLVKCSLNCEGITNDPTRGIIPRSLIKQERNGKNAVIVVGLNPGKCNKQEQDYYLKNGFSYKSLQNYFFETITLPILGNNYTKRDILHAIFTNCALIR
ncbi:MAG TPA: hypothetical protein VMW40_07815 [Candidatus Bathyarchaeia archaeon]|nr:hypothetical protein [Candidatus Bathyarchaeia archaeon]